MVKLFKEAIEQLGKRLDEIAKQCQDLQKEIAQINEHLDKSEHTRDKIMDLACDFLAKGKKVLFINHSDENANEYDVIDKEDKLCAKIVLIGGMLHIYVSNCAKADFSQRISDNVFLTDREKIHCYAVVKFEIEKYYNNEVCVIGSL